MPYDIQEQKNLLFVFSLFWVALFASCFVVFYVQEELFGIQAGLLLNICGFLHKSLK